MWYLLVRRARERLEEVEQSKDAPASVDNGNADKLVKKDRDHSGPDDVQSIDEIQGEH